MSCFGYFIMVVARGGGENIRVLSGCGSFVTGNLRTEG